MRYSVAFVADNKYVEHFCVALQSLLVNNKDLAFDIYLLNEGLTEKNSKNIAQIIKNFDVRFYNKIIDETVFSHLHSSLCFEHITIQTYFRFAIPELIDAERVLYLDCDLVVTNSIKELFMTDFEDAYILAVADTNNIDKERLNELGKTLGMSENAKYFNAGIMVINMEKWRSDKIAEKVINYVENNPNIKFADQDGLNAIINGKWKELPSRYNIQRKLSMAIYEKNTPTQWQTEINNRCIIHFTEGDKPWKIRSRRAFINEYYKYLKMTPCFSISDFFKYNLIQKLVKNKMLLFLYRKFRGLIIKS